MTDVIDPDAEIAPERIDSLRRAAIGRLGLVYDPELVDRITTCLVDRVVGGLVGDGVTYAELARGARVPSWMAHGGLLGPVLALVSLRSYEEHKLLLGALTRARKSDMPPTAGFCNFLEEMGLVSSRHDRDACLEVWDHHWKKVVTHLETQGEI